MKPISRVFLLLLIAINAKAQLFNVTNFSGTTFYGGIGVTVTSTGSAMTGGGGCLGAPTTYWIGLSGPGTYTYTFSRPVYNIMVPDWALNGGPLGAGEYKRFYINGAPYAIQPSEVINYRTPGCQNGGPCYLSGGWMYGPVGATSDYNGDTVYIKSCIPINSFEVYCNGILWGDVYHLLIDTVKSVSCVFAINNGPCINDTLKLDMIGDSTGATYSWTGPGGFTSTLQNPFIFPAVFADTGWYYVIRMIPGASDTDSTHVVVHPKPIVIVTNNSPLCAGLIDTLQLFETPYSTGETFSWTGPYAFTSTLENPIRPGFMTMDTGTYTVIATTEYGCKDTGSTYVTVLPQPPPPVISGVTLYCQRNTFIPFTVTGYTGILEWYTTGIGGTAITTPIVINTSVAGYTTVWVSQRIGGCESPRTSITVRVVTTPPAPLLSGGASEYCQYIGSFKPFFVSLSTKTSKALWYTTSTGGTYTLTEPIVDITIPGTYNFWVSQTDSGCEGPRTPLVITVHPKPAPPKTNPPYSTCQYWPTSARVATASAPGDLITWYMGYSDITGNITAPVPSSAIPGIDTYYIDEVTSFGCRSDKTLDTFRVKPKPRAPLTRDTIYCQGTQAAALTADSSDGSRLYWFILGTALPMAPVPSNNVPGDSTWFVMQKVNGCPSDSTPLKVTTIYKPYFYITAQRPWDCQFDSLWLSYTGPSLNDAAYIWTLPTGASYALNSNTGIGISLPTDSMIFVRFDSVVQNNYVKLFASDNHGFCSFDTSIRITIVPHPTATSTSKADVCAGDTVSLALSSRSANASIFMWTIDHVPMETSTALNIISANSNSGGPFSISWNDSGRHVIEVRTTTDEGCTNPPSVDTVFVHTMPDASFTYTTRIGTPLCLEDSVMFVAKASDYNFSFEWTPAHYFQNINKGVTWGKVEQSRSIVTLLVTDPFGCAATTSQELDPSSCCTVSFPTAFTPNGDHRNDVFRPIYAGYHRFHIFRVANRWGQTVYEATNSNMQWDGNYNGVPQDIGVYFYYLSFDCGGKTIEQTGDVTLIR